MQNPLPSTNSTEGFKHKNAKVLVLGAAESGKSTICRHIRQLHGQQFTDAEILHFKKAIRESCLQHFLNSIADLLLDPTLHFGTKERCAELLQQYKDKSKIDREYIEEAVRIWKLTLVQKHIASITTIHDATENNACGGDTGIKKQNELNRLHSDNPGNLFLRRFDKIMEQGYSPILEDILNIRIPTTGIYPFPLNLIRSQNENMFKNIL